MPQTRTQGARILRAWRSVALAALTSIGMAVAAPSRPAIAAGTSPTLLLAAADAFPGAGGERLVTARGAFHFDDQLQVAFPAAGLLVVQGTRFVRFDVAGAVVAGTSAEVADGVGAAELPPLRQASGAASPPARLARLDRDRVAVVLPPELDAGPALVLLYASHEGEPFVSNAIAVTLP